MSPRLFISQDSTQAPLVSLFFFNICAIQNHTPLRSSVLVQDAQITRNSRRKERKNRSELNALPPFSAHSRVAGEERRSGRAWRSRRTAKQHAQSCMHTQQRSTLCSVFSHASNRHCIHTRFHLYNLALSQTRSSYSPGFRGAFSGSARRD